MTPFRLSLLDLSGGLNQGVPGVEIADNQFQTLRNLYPFGSPRDGWKLKRRPAVARVHANPSGILPTSLFALKTSTGTWTLILATTTGLARMVGQDIVDLSSADGTAFEASTVPGFHLQYLDIGYYARAGVGLRRHATDFHGPAGIAAPTAAPTLADGGAGALTAGDFYGVYTYYNPLTQQESNPSPASNALTLATAKKIDWSGVTISTNGQVLARRLYRTPVGQQGQYFFVAQLDDNVLTSYAGEQVTTNDLGRRVSFRNGLPPDQIECIALWNERLFASDGRDVFYSEVGLMECFYSLAVISVNPDDGHPVTILHPHGDRLMIGKTNSIHYLTTGPNLFEPGTLSERHGCVSPHSMRSAEGLLIWFAGDNFYRSDGASAPVPISSPLITPLLEAIQPEDYEKITAGVDEARGWYVVSLPDAAGDLSTVAVYHYRSGSWAAFDYPAGDGAPGFYSDFYDENQKRLLYATFPGEFYAFDLLSTANKDLATTNIEWELRSKDYGFDTDSYKKGLQRATLHCSSVAEDVTLKLFLDGASAPFKSRSVSLAHDALWKRFNLSSMQKMAHTISLGVAGAGVLPVDIAGFILQGIVSQREGKAF